MTTSEGEEWSVLLAAQQGSFHAGIKTQRTSWQTENITFFLSREGREVHIYILTYKNFQIVFCSYGNHLDCASKTLQNILLFSSPFLITLFISEGFA